MRPRPQRPAGYARATPHAACRALAPHLYKAAAGVAAHVRVVGLRQVPVERRRVELRARRPVSGARAAASARLLGCGRHLAGVCGTRLAGRRASLCSSWLCSGLPDAYPTSAGRRPACLYPAALARRRCADYIRGRRAACMPAPSVAPVAERCHEPPSVNAQTSFPMSGAAYPGEGQGSTPLHSSASVRERSCLRRAGRRGGRPRGGAPA
jgi:hypothetical protein